jgi:DNA mismatch repair protein MutS
MACKKSGNTLHFMHTIAPGVAHASFGLDVARLAHLPESIITRASEILETLHYEHPSAKTHLPAPLQPHALSPEHAQQLHHYQQLSKALNTIDLNTLSPKKAFDLVWELASIAAPTSPIESSIDS